jgi:hypothetical protein
VLDVGSSLALGILEFGDSLVLGVWILGLSLRHLTRSHALPHRSLFIQSIEKRK